MYQVYVSPGASAPQQPVIGSPASITLWPLGPDPSRAALSVSPDPQMGLPLTVTVMLADAYGNPCSSAATAQLIVTGSVKLLWCACYDLVV
jgi:hypothetical protein